MGNGVGFPIKYDRFPNVFPVANAEAKSRQKDESRDGKTGRGKFSFIKHPSAAARRSENKAGKFSNVFFELSNLDLIEKVYKFIRLPFWFLELSNVIYTPLVAE